MSQAKTAKEVLVAVHWIIKNHGWVQRKASSTENGKHSFCLVGALNSVVTDPMVERDARKVLYAILGKDDSIICWNDRPGRTKNQVLGLLRKAIKVAT